MLASASILFLISDSAVAVQKFQGTPAIVGAVGEVHKVSRTFLAQVSKDTDVQNWLISASDRDKTRGDYLEHLGRFLAWTGWLTIHLSCLDLVLAQYPQLQYE